LFKRKVVEQKIFEMLAEHLRLSVRATDIVVRELTLEKERRYEVESLASEVMALEKRGDEIVSDVVREISHGAVPPMLYGDMHVLTDLVDDILDELYFIAMEVSRGRKTGLDVNPVVNEVYEDLASMLSVARLAIERLVELFTSALKDRDRAQKIDRDVDVFEDRVDELRNVVMDKIYANKSQLDHLSFYHLVELVKAIDRVVDACEDASHLALSVISSIFG